MTPADRKKRTDEGKWAVLLIMFLSFLGVLIFNYFTCMMTDDYVYAREARSAGSLWALILQEANQYQTSNGRSVVHLLMRIFMVFPDIVFKVVNSLVFLFLSWLVYLNIEGRKKWDAFVMLLVQLSMWIFTVDFKQTVLWKDGACNYLWGTTIIMTFMTLMRLTLKNDAESGKLRKTAAKNRKKVSPAEVLRLIGVFALGLLAGWCNENTSGGGILFILILIVSCMVRGFRIPARLWTGFAGILTGFMIMITAPGYSIRASFVEENYSGFLKYVARFQKLTLIIREYFLVLLIAAAVTIILTVLMNPDKFRTEAVQPLKDRCTAVIKACIELMRGRILFLFLFLATSYALVLSPEPQPRAFFGAGVFLIIAVIQGIRSCLGQEQEISGKAGMAGKDSNTGNSGILVRALFYSAAAALSISFVFTYIDCGTDLQRIARDIHEREDYILEQKAAGNNEIVVAQLHPDFENRYTDAYNSELTEDPEYWINVAYEGYYGVDSISAIPYEEWEAQYK